MEGCAKPVHGELSRYPVLRDMVGKASKTGLCPVRHAVEVRGPTSSLE